MSVSMRRAPGGVLVSTLLAMCALAAMPAQAAPVDLSSWTREGAGGSWTVQPGNDAVVQSVNGEPTVFYSDYMAFGNQLSGTIRVNTGSDDDFIGFVVGFDPGELFSASSDFLLIDWKQANQDIAKVGLSLSHVTQGLGGPNAAWGHLPAQGVNELARGATLGNVGWNEFQTYTFDIAYTATSIKVFVDGVLQIDHVGNFTDGRFGFYNYSQANVTYAGITNVVLPPDPPVPGAVPEPATWGMMMLGFGVIGTAMRRQRRTRIAFS